MKPIPTWTELARTAPATVRGLYACDQAHEMFDRLNRIIDRVMPIKPTPHGFRDPYGFVVASQYTGERQRLSKELKSRLMEKIRARDARLTIEEIAARMDAAQQEKAA